MFEEIIIVDSTFFIAHQRTIDCRVLRKLLRVAWTPSSAMAEIGFLFNSFCGFMWTFNNTEFNVHVVLIVIFKLYWDLGPQSSPVYL